MGPRRGTLAVVAMFAAASGGCGVGSGESSEGVATLAVTRDYGAEAMLEASVADPSESETVIRLLDREAEITTRYGGGFVQSIAGVEGTIADGRSLDWFFFLNGIESSTGAADVELRAGVRVWWDYRDWTAALRTPAVVGSWPEPFLQASTEPGERLPVRVECATARLACDAVAERLAEEGVRDVRVVEFRSPPGTPISEDALRILVGPWARIDGDPVASLLQGDPETSGVFARFEVVRGRRPALVALDERAASARRSSFAGLIAALRDGDAPPTWVITGTYGPAVLAAARTLGDRELEHRYAVAVTREEIVRLPVTEPG